MKHIDNQLFSPFTYLGLMVAMLMFAVGATLVRFGRRNLEGKTPTKPSIWRHHRIQVKLDKEYAGMIASAIRLSKANKSDEDYWLNEAKKLETEYWGMRDAAERSFRNEVNLFTGRACE